MDLVVPAMNPVREALGELDFSQKVVRNLEAFTGMCGDYMRTYYILKQIQGSHLKDENCED